MEINTDNDANDLQDLTLNIPDDLKAKMNSKADEEDESPGKGVTIDTAGSEQIDKISLEALNMYITSNHPRNKDNEPFGLCDYLGEYDSKFLCTETDHNITDMAKEIQIGPSMFLLSTYQILKFFFWLSVLNIPVYIFLHSVSYHEEEAVTPSVLFGSFTIGNIG